MKKLLWLFCVCSLLSFLQTTVSAQDFNISSTLPSAGLTMCGTEEDFQISVQNISGSSVSGRTLTLNFDDNGIYFRNAQSNLAGVTISPDPITGNVNSITVDIQSLAVSQTVLISFEGIAGCNVNIGGNNSINSSIRVTEGSSVLHSNSFVVNRSTNGSIISQINNSQVQDLTERTFVLQNVSAPFNGYFTFTDVHGTAVHIEDIELTYTSNTGLQTLTIQNGVPVQLTGALVNSTITVKEKIAIIGCVTSSNGRSDFSFNTGCLADEICSTISYSTILGNLNLTPQLSWGPDNWDDYFKCFGGDDYQEHFITFKNTGTGSTNNFAATFLPANGYITDPSSFVIEILDADMNVISGGAFEAEPSDVITDVVFTYDYVNPYYFNNEIGTLSYYRDIVVSELPNFDQYYTCEVNEDFIFSRLIRRYRDSNTGQLTDIVLLPGQSIRFKWQDRSCCPKAAALQPGSRFSKPIMRLFSQNCQGNSVEIGGTFNYHYNSVGQQVEVYAPLLNGNPDRCITSNDGQIGNYSIYLKGGQINHYTLPVDMNQWGDWVVEFELEDGLDLDLSLGGTGVLGNSTCTNATCGTCSPALWNASDPNRYNLIYKPINTASYQWTPYQISLASSVPNTKKIYRAYFHLADLMNLSGYTSQSWYNPAHNQTYIATLLSQQRLDFSLRSFCTSLPESGLSQRVYYNPPCTEGCMMWLNEQTMKFAVTCPGCITPGGNITTYTFERDEEYLGQIDEVDASGNSFSDQAPDGTGIITNSALKSNCTNGDLMHCNFTVVLSNGQNGSPSNPTPGYELNVLASKNIILDNLYIQLSPSVAPGSTSSSSILIPEDVNMVEVSIDGGVTWHTVSRPLVQAGTDFYVHITASDLGISSGNFHASVGQNIQIRVPFRINNDIQVTGEKITPIYIRAEPDFSDCDNCLSASGLAFPGGDAANVSCDWTQVGNECPGILPDAKYYCQSSLAMINFIPTKTETISFLPSSNTCNKELVLRLGAFPVEHKDAFVREYRTFLKPGQQVTFTADIPNGYVLSNLEFRSSGTNETRDTYIISESDLANAISSGLINMSGQHMSVNLSFQYLNSSNVNTSIVENYSGQALRLFDDYMNIEVIVRYKVNDCPMTTMSSIFADASSDLYCTPSYTYQLTNMPRVTTPAVPSLNAGNYKLLYYGHTRLIPTLNPNTLYQAQTVTTANQSAGYYYVPVTIDNLEPKDASGNFYYDCFSGNSKIPSQNAENPFLYVTNLVQLTSLGFSIEGVYEGNISSIPSAENFYDNTSGVAKLKKNGSNMILANTIQNRYTVVLRYTCPEGCDPLLESCATSDAFLPACIQDEKFLNLKYGWNCGTYPTSQSEVEGACFVASLDPVELITNAVAVETSSTLNNGNPVQFCNEFDYTVRLASCRQGGTSDLDLTLALPSSIEYVTHTTVYDGNAFAAVATVNGTNVQVDNLIDPSDVSGLDNVQAVEVTFRLRWNNISSSDANTISAVFSGTTYCGSAYTRSVTDVIPGGTVIIQNIAPDYCITNPPVVFTSVIPGGTFTSTGNGLTDHADGTATFDPSVAGLGTYTITYTVNGCVVSSEVTVIDAPAVAIVATPSTKMCDGGNIHLETNPANFSTYIWTKNSDPMVLSTASMVDISAIATPPVVTYHVQVETTPGCINTASIQLSLPTIELNHASACFTTSTVLSPIVTGLSSEVTYQWYKDGIAITPNGNQLNYTVTSSGVYYLVATDGPCVLTSSSVTLYQGPSVEIVLPNDGGLGFYCGGTTVLTANVTGGTGVIRYNWTGPGFTGDPASASITANTTGTYTVTVTDDHCTATDSETITIGYEYQIGDISWVCGSSNKNICVPVNAVFPVRNGIIGMDFTLRYDKRYVTPVTTISNSNLGSVVLGSGNPGTYAISVNPSPIVETDPNIGFAQVSIYYLGNSSTAQFSGSGLVICVPFTVVGTPAAGAGFDFSMYEMYESYTLHERLVCWGKGRFDVVYGNTFRGSMQYHQPYSVTGGVYNYYGIVQYSGATNPALTKITVLDQCHGNVLGVYDASNAGNGFNVPITAATNVIKINRDINNATPLNYLNYVNARDTRAMEYITTRSTTACVNQLVLSNCPTVFIPTPGQMIAADVNMSDSVRANDITLLQRRMINVIGEFPQVPNLSGKPSVDWRFFDPDLVSTYPDFTVSSLYPFSDGAIHYWRDNVPNIPECLAITPQCANSPNELFRGILLGDVINYQSQYTPNTSLKSTGTNGEVSPFTYTIDLYSAIKVNDTEFDVPVYYNAPDTSAVYGFDFGLEYNSDSVVITDVEEHAAIIAKGSRLMWNDDVASNTIRSTNYTPEVWSVNGICYYLRVKKYTGGELTKADIKGGYGMMNGEWANVVVLGKAGNVTGVYSPDGLVNDIRIVPSPVITEANIEYWLSQPDAASNIIITNTLGQIILKYDNLTIDGRISLSPSSLEKGVYFCTLNDVATGRSKTVKFVVE